MRGYRTDSVERDPSASGRTAMYNRPYCFGYTVPCASDALCVDGQVRRFRTAINPDTYFSLPARGSFLGVSVGGYIGTDAEGEYCFHLVHSHKHYPTIAAKQPGLVSYYRDCTCAPCKAFAAAVPDGLFHEDGTVRGRNYPMYVSPPLADISVARGGRL